VTNAKNLLTVSKTTDATKNLTNAGPRVVKPLLIVKAAKWFALTDNVNLIIRCGKLDVKLMPTVLVMLSPVILDIAGVLTVLKVPKLMELLKKIQLLLLLLILLLLP